MALSTPGYCTFTATIAAVGHHRPVHLADRRRRDGHGVPVEEELVGVVAQLVAHDLLGQARRHRRDVGLQGGQRRLRLGRQALGDEGDHLARLHDGALHVAEHLGHVLRRPDGELLLELGRGPRRRPHRGPSRCPSAHPPGGRPPHTSRTLDSACDGADRGPRPRQQKPHPPSRRPSRPPPPPGSSSHVAVRVGRGGPPDRQRAFRRPASPSTPRRWHRCPRRAGPAPARRRRGRRRWRQGGRCDRRRRARRERTDPDRRTLAFPQDSVGDAWASTTSGSSGYRGRCCGATGGIG